MINSKENENNITWKNKSGSGSGSDSDALIRSVETLSELLVDKGIIIEDIEQIYDDKLYIDIIKVLTKKQIDIIPQHQSENKVDNLRYVLRFLSNVIEMNLEHINPYQIIIAKNQKLTKWLLDLLIIVLQIIQYNEEGDQCIDNQTDQRKKKELSKSHENDASFIHRKLNDKRLQLEEPIEGNAYIDIDNDNKEDYLMSFCPKANNKNKIISNKLINKYKNNDRDRDRDMTTDSINNSNDDISKESTFNYGLYIQNNQSHNKSKQKHLHNQKKKRSLSAIQTQINKSFYAFDYLPLSIDQLRKEIIYQTKIVLSPNKYNTLIHTKKKSFNSTIDKIILNLINKLHMREYKSITYNYIKHNMKTIHQLINQAFNLTKANYHNQIIKQIAIAMMNDHCILKNINEIESALARIDIKSKRQMYQSNRKMSDAHIDRVKQIYQTAYQYEEEKCIEEKRDYNSLCVRKEAKIIIENKDRDEYLFMTKEYLEELERYERFKRKKELHLRKLTILTE